MSERPLAVLAGRGGQDRDVIDAILASGRKVEALLAPPNAGPEILGLPVLGEHDRWSDYVRRCDFVVTVSPTQRRVLGDAITSSGGTLGTVVHPAATISPHGTVLPGAVVLAGCVIAPDANVGSLTILNANCSVDHDCVLGTAVQFGPGVTLAGGVTVGDEAFLGVGVAVMPGVTIGPRAVVGAGAVVIRDVPEGVTVVGNPARALK